MRVKSIFSEVGGGRWEVKELQRNGGAAEPRGSAVTGPPGLLCASRLSLLLRDHTL